MKIKFSNLNEDERVQVFDLANSFPNDIVVREIVASFDGEIALELITSLGPAVITGVTTIIAAIIARKEKQPNDNEKPTIILVFNDGRTETINDYKDLKKVSDHP